MLDEALGEREDGSWAAFEVGLVVSRQNGKGPHSLDTPILTTDGWTTMGDIRSGQRVYGADGQPVTVLACSEMYPDDVCYEVAFSDGSRHVVGEDHLWRVKDVRAGAWINIRTAELAQRCGARRPDNGRMEYRYRVACDAVPETPEVELPIDPYLLGYWLGDGTRTAATITVGSQDRDWVAARLELAGARVIRTSQHDHGHAWGLHFRLDARVRDGFESRCRRLGVWGDKHIPEMYLTASPKQRAALLAGLMDSDGSIATTSRSPQVEFGTSVPKLAEGFWRLARSLGIRVEAKEGETRLNGKPGRNRFRFLWTPAFNPFEMPRKAEKFRAPASQRHRLMSVTGVRRVASVPTRCIQVDRPDGVYLVGRTFTPTHNSILEARELAGLFLFGEQLLIHSAHLFDTSLEAFHRIMTLLESTPDLERRIKRVSRSHGEEGIELFGGQRLRFKTRTKGGGRGLSGDCVIVDEAMYFGSTQVKALMPTMSARPNPQMWYTGSAGDRESEQLGRVRDRGISGTDPRLCYLEWSVEACSDFCPPDCEEHDPTGIDNEDQMSPAELDRQMARMVESYRRSNPGLGIRIAVEHVESERRSMDRASFAAERLGVGDWPVEGDAYRVIGKDSWESRCDTDSRPAAPMVFAIDTTPDRSYSAIAVAAWNQDGLKHVEITGDDQVLDYRPGTRWVAARMVELAQRWKPAAIIIDAKSQAGEFVSALEDAGLTVVCPAAREYAQACGMFVSGISPRPGEEPSVVHRGQTPLTTAVAGAEKRNLADAWAWDKRSAAVDICPLTAATLAVWGLEQHGHKKKPKPLAAWA